MFISFEGIDGSGKSTQIQMLLDRLGTEGHKVQIFREPGGAVLSEKIRSLLLDPDLDIHPYAEMLLFSAARAQLVAKKIKPALEEGETVICDRFFDSTIAYQGAGRKLEEEQWLQNFQQRVTQGLVPRRTYLLKISLETSIARRKQREGNQPADRMEQEVDRFFQDVIAAYDKLAVENPDRFVVLDGDLPAEVLHQQIWDDYLSNR